MSETSGNSGTESEKMERIRKELADQENLELTLEEQQAEMDKLVPPFRARHIPEEIFNVEQAQLDGHSFKNYLKLVKTVHNLEKDGHLGKAISKGGALGFWELYTEMTRAEFVKFARWLTSTEGVDFVFGLQKMKKYTSKAKDSVTPRQIAISGVFTHMLQKYSSEVKETRSKYDKEIARMERELRLKRKEKEREIGKLIDQYKPASLYVPPKDEEVGLVARELYEADCERKGKAKKTVATGLLEYAKQLFGQEARNRFEIAFASKEEYQDALMKYLAEQVCLFRGDADDSKARNGEYDLALIGGEQSAKLALAAAEERIRDRAPRQAPAAAPTAPVPPIVPDNQPGDSEQSQTRRSPTVTRSASRSRAEEAQADAGGEHEAQSSKKRPRGGPKKNPRK
uniref:ORF1p n=1 Tax=Secale cereale amalgavirus 1 TaxID=2058878 RepID=A0A2Z6JSL3_9VIRU|nr:TPA_exp: ORF1p [Secale cereale amalgavirus 1]